MRSLMGMSQKQHFTKYGFWAYKEPKGFTRIYMPKQCMCIERAMVSLNLLPNIWYFAIYPATLESFGDKDTL
jgi:hypothetical protein